MYIMYRVAQECGTLFVRRITSSNVDQYKNVTCLSEPGKLCHNTITKDPITSQTCRYLVKCQCLKATIENKTSVATNL